MTGSSRLSEVCVWLISAREDLDQAAAVVSQEIGRPRHACFYAQQSVEKVLKGALIFSGIAWTRTHDLDELRNLLPAGWSVAAAHPVLARLTEFAVEVRYPDSQVKATAVDAQLAVTQAQAVWATITADLRRRGFDVNVELT